MIIAATAGKVQTDSPDGNFLQSGISPTSLGDDPADPCYFSAMISLWGFDLDMSAVRLMRHEGDQWQEVARENIDGPDIEDRLIAMVGKVRKGTAVHLFLPREQILYTDVKISSENAARREIEAAMDGLTPYALDELEIDWVVTAPDTARVAAIAKETLGEAAAFAEMRGLSVAGYSSLADPEDFPGLPDFGGTTGAAPDELPVDMPPDQPDAAAPEDDAAAEPVVAFSSVREVPPADSAPLALPRKTAPQPDQSGPVVRVDDATPVMQVREKLPPLNPGQPLDQISSAPRVRTDIAAGTLSGAAASLRPAGPSIRVRSAHPVRRHTLAVFAVAAVLTVGIAIIVWSLLPLAPGRTNTETGLATDIAEPSPSATAEGVPNLPEPDVALEAVELPEIADAEPSPSAPETTGAEIARPDATGLFPAQPDTNLAPQTSQPLERSPDTLAGLLTDAPSQGLDGSEETSETTLDIYLASVERRDLAFDAIALPSPSTFNAGALPQIGTPPAEPGDGTVLASIDPAQQIPEAADAPTAPETAAETGPTDNDQLSAAELRPTALAAALTDRPPRARPGDLVAQAERQVFGGRTRDELGRIAPRRRPESAQVVAQTNRTETTASDLAVETSAPPRNRPDGFDAVVAAAVAQSRAAELTASVEFDTPDTSAAIEAALAEDAEPEPRPQDSPRLAIPSTASVARQATIENALPLNKINLVGVYGVPSDRRALIRLASGRYVKVKVGDRVDGGTVAQINDSEILYRKGSRTVSLKMPQG